MIDETDLPDELQGKPGGPATSMTDEERASRLAKLGLAIAAKRDEAVRARKDSGIEAVWAECEAAYISMDDANAHEFAKAKWAKPTSIDGPVTRNNVQPDETKSTAFIPLTARYVDAGAAMVSEIILPIDGKAFGLTSTPVPDLVEQIDDNRQVVDDAPEGTGQPLTRPAGPNDAPPADPAMAVSQNGPQPQPGPPSQVPLTVKDLVQEKLDEASQQAEKAEQRIYDWMVEAKYPLQMRKVVFDASRIGAGVLKAPFPQQRKKRALTITKDAVALQYEYKTAPDMKWIDPWNFFPNGSCGEDIHEGDDCFERDFISEGKLKVLKNEKTSSGKPIYIPDAIDRVIAEGPEKSNVENGNPSKEGRKSRFTIWYSYARLSRDDMALAGAHGMEDLPDEVVECHAIVTLVNDTVIRVTLNPLDSGNFPYRVLSWSRRAGHWAGRGVGEQVSVAQRIVNGGTRRLLENAGKSAGCQFVIDPSSIKPGDNSWTITPDKIWLKQPDATMDDVRKAFMSVAIRNVGEQLMKIIDYGFKIAEEASSIPLITQGQQGESSPETFGQAELQNTNAHTMLRAKAYAVDDNITEPLINDLYDWLLMDPSVPNDEKGDFDIDAHGSIVMVEKAIQEQFLMQMGNLILNPVFGKNPKKWMNEVLKSKRLDASKMDYTEQEAAEMAKRPPPEDPRVTAAKIAAGATTQKSKMDTDRDTAYVNAEAEKNKNDHEARMTELALKKELAMLDYATRRGIALDQVKAELAQTTMKLDVQKDLSLAGHIKDLHVHHSTPQVITPPTEPVGRAEPGAAFQQ